MVQFLIRKKTKIWLLAHCVVWLTACGGGDNAHSSKKALTSAINSDAVTTATSASPPSPSESIALQVRGAALNTQELADAQAEAESLPADMALDQLIKGQTAPLAAYQSGQVARKAATSQVAVYRFYNTRTGTHFYTSSTSERDSVRANLRHMTYEGQAFLAASAPSAGLKPVYRFFNTQTGVHFYTISESERASIEANLPQFNLEGAAYYASQVGGIGFTSLYRFFLPATGTHFYTASDEERQRVIDTLGSSHRYEGVAYHVLTGNCEFVNGTAQQAEREGCYLANNDAAVVITLPPANSLRYLDIVRVAGVGAGGWRIAQNAGQVIQIRDAPVESALAGRHWAAAGGNRNWTSVAASDRGFKLVAGAEDPSGEFIYRASQGGVSWTPNLGARGNWQSVASSADGNKLVALTGGTGGGSISTSTDGGRTWRITNAPNLIWMAVASSADGNKLVAAARGASDGGIYISTNAGLSWTATSAPRGQWQSVASSADGSILVAGAIRGEWLYTSNNAGATWTRASPPAGWWWTVAASADGQTLFAGDYGGAPLYVSTDAGTTWAPMAGVARGWISIASAADGRRLIAAADGGRLLTSFNAGITWTERETRRDWRAVASSADGTTLLAADYGGQLYTSLPSSTPGTAGGLKGGPGSSVQLNYMGDNVFSVQSTTGQVSAQ